MEFLTKALLFTTLIIIISSSCVPNRKVVYLQDGREKEDIITDSVLGTYFMVPYEYQLQPQDIISIKVSSLTPTQYNFFKETERELGATDPLLSGYVIDEEGFIEIPAVGKLFIQGLTLKEAEEKIKSSLASYLNDPVVRVKMLNFKVTVLGEVNRPGSFNSYNSKLNIMEAIAQAGDLTQLADRSNVKMVRYDGSEAKMIYVNTLDDDLLSSPYFYLRPHDLIIVSPLDVKNIRQYQLPTISLILTTITALSFFFFRINN